MCYVCKFLNKYILFLRLKKKMIFKDKFIRCKNYIWILVNCVNILKGLFFFYKYSFVKYFSLRRY